MVVQKNLLIGSLTSARGQHLFGKRGRTPYLFETDKPLVDIDTPEKIRKAHGFNMRVGELADEAGVTTRTLEARFRAAIGLSVGNVIRTSCLDEVRKLVEQQRLYCINNWRFGLL